MDVARLAMRLSVVLCLGFLVVVTAWSAMQPHPSPVPSAVLDKQGKPLAVPTVAGRTSGVWDRQPVLVFVTTAKELAGVDAARGAGSATPSIEVPGHPELRLFVLSAISTHLGCTVGWDAELGASRDIPDYDGDGTNDGRILDVCHQGQWDAFHRAAPLQGTPAPTRLAQLDVTIQDGLLLGDGFDGPIGPAAR